MNTVVYVRKGDPITDAWLQDNPSIVLGILGVFVAVVLWLVATKRMRWI